jgi:hypothetical protein
MPQKTNAMCIQVVKSSVTAFKFLVDGCNIPESYPRAIKILKSCDTKIDLLFKRTFWIQERIDDFRKQIDAFFQTPQLDAFYEEIKKPENEKSYHEFVLFLAKLPLLAGCDLLQTFKKMMQTIFCHSLYLVAHPLHIPVEIAKILINLALTLSQPDTWIMIGAGLIGTQVGFGLTIAPFYPMVMMIGLALAFSGISWGMIRSALDQNQPGQQKIGDQLVSQGQIFCEQVAASYCYGLLIGGLQQVLCNQCL